MYLASICEFLKSILHLYTVLTNHPYVLSHGNHDHIPKLSAQCEPVDFCHCRLWAALLLDFSVPQRPADITDSPSTLVPQSVNEASGFNVSVA